MKKMKELLNKLKGASEAYYGGKKELNIPIISEETYLEMINEV